MKSRIVLLLPLFATLLVPGCAMHHRMGHPGNGSTDATVERATIEVSNLIDRTVQDPNKASRAKAIMEQIVAEARESRQQNRQFHQALYQLNARYDAEPEQFLEIIDQLNARRMQTATKILRLRFDVKALMTEQEWKAVTDGMADMRSRYTSSHHSE